eukprot:5616620-Pleurochrysis_carterae.AAC.2
MRQPPPKFGGARRRSVRAAVRASRAGGKRHGAMGYGAVTRGPSGVASAEPATYDSNVRFVRVKAPAQVT